MQLFDRENINLNEDWKRLLKEEIHSEYFQHILDRLSKEKKDGKTVFPPENEIFSALNATSLDDIKVVIIGQDPYHGVGQAHGLCFSVKRGVAQPPSLVNIFKELNNDLKIPVPKTGELTSWAKQGVLLLNAILTVRADQAGSHQQFGWQRFTDSIIRLISETQIGIVFLLWGAFAQSKEALIDADKHFILKTSHPSPLSAYQGFLGSKPFSKTNEILRSIGRKEIDWRIND